MGPLLVQATKSAGLFDVYLTCKVILAEGHIGSLTKTPTFLNVKNGLNQCRREGKRTREGRAGGNMCRGGQRKESFIGIKRERTGTGKAGDKLWVDITKDREGKPVSTEGCLSPEPKME